MDLLALPRVMTMTAAGLVAAKLACDKNGSTE